MRYNAAMQRALSFLREAIEAFHRGESAAELSRMRDPASDREPSSAGYALRLLSNEGSEALAEVRESGELPADEVEWLGRQRAAMRILLTRSRGERAARKRLAELETTTVGTLIGVSRTLSSVPCICSCLIEVASAENPTRK